MSEGIETVEDSSADVMTAADSHGSEGRYRPMRGQAYILLEPRERGHESVSAGGIIIPGTHHNAREDIILRGVILALGPPSRVNEYPDSPEVAWDCAVGDEIFFYYSLMTEKGRTFGRGVEDVAVVAQVEIQAVAQ